MTHGLPRLPLNALRIATVAVVLMTLAATAHAQGVKLQKLGGGRYMTETVRNISAEGLSQLLLTSPGSLGGTVTVVTRPVDSVRVEMVKVFKVASSEMAATWEPDIACDLTPSGSALRVDVRTRGEAPWEGTNWSARIELTITVPPNWDLDINARFFEFDLTGPFGSALVRTEFGRVKLQKVTKRVSVSGSYTGIELNDVRGEITAQTSYADLQVRAAIPAAERAARLVNSAGAITVQNLVGAIDIETENAPVTLSELVLMGSESSLRGSNAPVKAEILEFGDAELAIRNSNAPVSLRVPRSLSARLKLTAGGGGRIRTEGLMIQTHADQLRAGRLEGICGSGQGALDIDVTGFGQIELVGR